MTAGIDFALTLMAELFGEDRARMVQLSMEYGPAPPFAGGSSATSSPAIVETVTGWTVDFQRRRSEAAQQAAARLTLR